MRQPSLLKLVFGSSLNFNTAITFVLVTGLRWFVSSTESNCQTALLFNLGLILSGLYVFRMPGSLFAVDAAITFVVVIGPRRAGLCPGLNCQAAFSFGVCRALRFLSTGIR